MIIMIILMIILMLIETIIMDRLAGQPAIYVYLFIQNRLFVQ